MSRRSSLNLFTLSSCRPLAACTRRLKSARVASRAEILAREWACHHAPFDTIDKLLTDADIVITAVASGRRSWDWPLLAGTVTTDMSETRVGKANTTESGMAQGAPTLTQRLISGGTLVLGATLDFATDFLGSDGITVGSLLDAERYRKHIEERGD